MTLEQIISELEFCPSDVAYLLEGDIGHYAWDNHLPGITDWAEPPRYTRSLDAALTLVPHGNWWEIKQTCSVDSPLRHFGSRNGLFSARTHENYGADGFRGDHDSPAIALCIAALKCRLKQAAI